MEFARITASLNTRGAPLCRTCACSRKPGRFTTCSMRRRTHTACISSCQGCGLGVAGCGAAMGLGSAGPGWGTLVSAVQCSPSQMVRILEDLFTELLLSSERLHKYNWAAGTGARGLTASGGSKIPPITAWSHQVANTGQHPWGRSGRLHSVATVTTGNKQNMHGLHIGTSHLGHVHPDPKGLHRTPR